MTILGPAVKGASIKFRKNGVKFPQNGHFKNYLEIGPFLFSSLKLLGLPPNDILTSFFVSCFVYYNSRGILRQSINYNSNKFYNFMRIYIILRNSYIETCSRLLLSIATYPWHFCLSIHIYRCHIGTRARVPQLWTLINYI